ncbi:signal peptidase II [Corynebacterium uberis]|uniref:signal peptidase II n=2 Tax=Corynebacterium TaxID=1716 RepID=UPI0037DCC58E
MNQPARRYWPAMFALIVALAAIDQAAKHAVVAHLTPGVPVPVVGDWARLLLVFNPGAAFSMGQGSTWLFTCFQLAFLVGVMVYAPRVKDPWTATGLALIGGGAAGNLVDRLTRPPQFFLGHVVDFISIGRFAVFNIADAAITVGVIAFLVGMVLQEVRARATDSPDSRAEEQPGGQPGSRPGDHPAQHPEQ